MAAPGRTLQGAACEGRKFGILVFVSQCVSVSLYLFFNLFGALAKKPSAATVCTNFYKRPFVTQLRKRCKIAGKPNQRLGIFSASRVCQKIPRTVCCLHSRSAVVYEIPASPTNFRSFPVIGIKSHLLFNHCICIHDFMYICIRFLIFIAARRYA